MGEEQDVTAMTTEDLAVKFTIKRDLVNNIITKKHLTPVRVFRGRRFYDVESFNEALAAENSKKGE